jgi:hypothetical protein
MQSLLDAVDTVDCPQDIVPGFNTPPCATAATISCRRNTPYATASCSPGCELNCIGTPTGTRPQPASHSVAHESRILVVSLVLARIPFSRNHSKILDDTRRFSIALDHTRSRLGHLCASLASCSTLQTPQPSYTSFGDQGLAGQHTHATRHTTHPEISRKVWV